MLAAKVNIAISREVGIAGSPRSATRIHAVAGTRLPSLRALFILEHCFILIFSSWLCSRTALALFARNCPGWLASDGPEGEDQFFRLLHERFEDIPALLFGGREHGSDDHEVIGAVLGTESTGDFLP